MKYISVCSGIEAASVAWQPLGWEAVAFSEIEAFPNAVLAYRFPDVPNLGDISKVDWRPYHGTVDLVVGGTPCQSFSVAGKREGLDGASGLVREYFRLLDEVRPRWFVWENVPGSLSSGNPKGSDFEFILQQWSHIGYHVSWRVLDAQYFGVAQRRRRVFAVGSLGDWRDSVKVLFEPESMSGHPAPCRKAREENPRGSATGAGKTSGFRMTAFGEYADDDTGSALKARDYKDATDLVCQYGDVAGTLSARHDSSPCTDRGQNIVYGVTAKGNGDVFLSEERHTALSAGGGMPGQGYPTVFSIAGNVVDREVNQNGCGFKEECSFALNTIDRHAVAECYSFDSLASNSMKSPNPDSGCRKVEVSKTLDTSNGDPSKNQDGIAVVVEPSVTPPITTKWAREGWTAYDETAPLVLKDREGKPGGGKGILIGEDKSFTLSCNQDQAMFHQASVRRLTPTECERLQGFPDGWTDIEFRGKPAPDGARYKALGNSMAVPCMAWIGKRIQMAEDGEL